MLQCTERELTVLVKNNLKCWGKQKSILNPHPFSEYNKVFSLTIKHIYPLAQTALRYWVYISWSLCGGVTESQQSQGSCWKWSNDTLSSHTDGSPITELQQSLSATSHPLFGNPHLIHIKEIPSSSHFCRLSGYFFYPSCMAGLSGLHLKPLSEPLESLEAFQCL